MFGDLITQAGPYGLLAVGVLMVLLGWLVPIRNVKRIEQERDYWRAVALKTLGHTDQLMPAADITTRMVEALADLPKRERPTE